MDTHGTILLVLNAHLPFVMDYQKNSENLFFSVEEDWFFEVLSETYLPLLVVFERLAAAGVPFSLGISLSPLLCHMMQDEFLIKKFIAYTDKQIEFGLCEAERTQAIPELNNLAKMYCDLAVERKIAFTERYECNLLKVFDYYRHRGRIEIIAAPATNAFLPFFSNWPETIQAQIETARAGYRRHFNRFLPGFWLPELGWSAELDINLRPYNLNYTIVDTHGFVFGRPVPARGSFFPVKTPAGMIIFSRDYYAGKDLDNISKDSCRDNSRDAGYELPSRELIPFINANGVRMRSGYKYWAHTSGHDTVYNPDIAAKSATEQARVFLEAHDARLAQAAGLMKETPVCVCACDADVFGRFWYEGPVFLEALFRLSAEFPGIGFMTPSEYLSVQDLCGIETSVPEFSSCGRNGYAETWLDSPNDWLYRHLARAQDRMIELAQRFPDASGLNERTLNQAVRELLLAQASDWPKLLYRRESSEYARTRIEDALRNFTTIYESLGSNYISTEWLTKLEKRHNVFPDINYRIFQKKH
jgi:1,4-alpha-glucan branching enzyme